VTAPPVKLLRTIRLDPSDTFVFERAAEPGEWAVSGAFAFWDGDPERLAGKARAAFRSGLLGVASLGWSTLAQIVETTEAEQDALIEALASQLVACFGAPDLETARTAAREEVTFARSLCDHAPGTVIAVQRRLDGGEIRESFRSLAPRVGAGPVFSLVADEDDGAEDEIDMLSLARDARS
jgi:hypothetical protein